MTRFGRRPEVSVKQLVREAVAGALQDAGLQVGAIRASFFACTTQGALEGQHTVAGVIALRDMGFSSSMR